MKSRPILFSAPMVRAILEGRKTQTRRIVKNAHIITCDDRTGATDNPCPYGVPGDELWLREQIYWNEESGWQYAADHASLKWKPADMAAANLWLETRPFNKIVYPSIHMPRWASRLTLRVLSVRVERLQDISEADAIAEGVQTERDHYGGDVPLKVHGSVAWHRYDSMACSAVSAVESYRTLWDSINGPGSWDANPWVWVVGFEKGGA